MMQSPRNNQGMPSLRALSVPTLETERLILRELVESDAPAYQKHFANWEVVKTLANVLPWPYPEGGALDYIRNFVVPYQGKAKWVWAITLKENPTELVGALDLWRNANPSNRGFWLAHHLWGQKLMSEAVVATTEFAFNNLGFEELHLSNATGNPASGRLKEKFGAVKVDVVPYSFMSSEYTHSERWILTKEAWRNYRATNQESA
jgi:ribosomal-protein-alanine N-acetyltransferase